MDRILKNSLAGAALAFAGLNLYAIYMLKKGTTTIDEVNKTIVEVRGAVRGLSGEAEYLIHQAGGITEEVKGKINTVDPLLESAHDVGEVISSVTNSVREAAARIKEKQTSTVYSSTPNLHIRTK
ncbi:DUF948 domain-containing protein [Paenibacillus pini]|uniref:General stress protein n=1 Tax=Paenibacillus pini JCM 16418 TaxID=1236976 RepID=W7YJ30_9BACL|nr:DUF948 domain-containing protein [Paenibacillus pini]GAF08482.1 hypothetical protein JCM16418_2563 [Paenibacillus pini JCM 16418]